MIDISAESAAKRIMNQYGEEFPYSTQNREKTKRIKAIINEEFAAERAVWEQREKEFLKDLREILEATSDTIPLLVYQANVRGIARAALARAEEPKP